MKRLIILGLLACLSNAPRTSAAEEFTRGDIYERTSPAVVMIIGYSHNGQRGSGGTGSIIHQDGLILTNAHVVVDEPTGRAFPRLTAYLKPEHVTGEQKKDLSHGITARVLAVSQPLDLALLKLETVPGPLQIIRLDDSDQAHIGDPVLAIGHPEQGGLWTLTTGTISAEFDNFNATKGKAVFQTETGLNRGNSGGPLLDAQGRMIGVNTAIARLAADGLPIMNISFSLKSNVVKRWLQEQDVFISPESPAPSQEAIHEQVAANPGTPGGGPMTQSASRQFRAGDSPAAPLSSQVTPTRPYNLDRLVNERSRAEADLEDLIKEMRAQFRDR